MDKKITILSQRKCNLNTPCYNTILGLEDEFLLSESVDVEFFNKTIFFLNRITKKIFGRAFFKDKILIKKLKKRGGYFFFSAMGIYSLSLNINTLKEIEKCKNCHIILYCFDTWEPKYEEFEKIFKKIRPQYLFCTYLKSAEHFKRVLSETRVYWLQQSMDKTVFYDYGEEKKRLFIQMGRKNESLHHYVFEYLDHNKIENNNKNYNYMKENKKPIYKNKFDLAKNINATKFFITAPQNIDNYKITGNISEVTARYFEAMAAKSLIVGYKPEDSFDLLFPFDNAMITVKPDGSDFDEKINYYLEHEDEYNEIINRNYKYVNNNHTWTNRLNYIMECLNKKRTR